MKIPFWGDPNKDIEILEASEDEQDKYGHRYGSDTIVLSPEHIKALQDGKMLAWNDGEYSTFIVLAAVKKDEQTFCTCEILIPTLDVYVSKCSVCGKPPQRS